MTKYLKNVVRNEDGVTAVEYSVLAVLMIAAVVLAMGAFSGALTTSFGNIGTQMASAQVTK